MSKDKISSQEMIDQVAASLSVSKRVAEEFLKSLFAEIEETLLNGEPVKIKNLGTFKMQWNEPRKSVNVQTGEVIVLEGFNKVTFTPDTELKDAVNEPYSHLDAIDLDESDQPVSKPTEVEHVVPELTEGLRNLSEQASEIKDLLSEIKALSIKEKAPQPSVRDYEIPDYELILIDEEPEIKQITENKIEEEEEEEEEESDDDDDEAIEEEDTIEEVEEVEDEQEKSEEFVQTEEIAEIQATLVDETTSEELIVEEPQLVENTNFEQTELNKEDISELQNEVEIHSNEIVSQEQEQIAEHIQEEEIEYKKESESEEPTYSPVYEQVPQTTYISNKTELKEAVSSPFILGKTKKKRKGLKFTFLFLLFIALIVGGIYIAYASSSCFSCWFKYTLLSEENREKADKYWIDAKNWFDFSDNKKNAAAPKTKEASKTAKNDSLNVTKSSSDTTTEIDQTSNQTAIQAPDSFDIAFKKRRNYNEFIGEETISEGTRLTTVSQQYYGKREFWVYIYEANRDNIVHPDRITPGTVVKVPKVDPRLIDKKNPKCLQKARELHDLYVGKK